MFSDYRQFGITESSLETDGATLAADVPPASSASGFMHILALTDVALTDIVLRYPRAGATPMTALTIPAGGQLLAVKNATITTGNAQVFYFRS